MDSATKTDSQRWQGERPLQLLRRRYRRQHDYHRRAGAAMASLPIPTITAAQPISLPAAEPSGPSRQSSAPPFYGAPGDEYGTSVGISGNTVIVSAPHGRRTTAPQTRVRLTSIASTAYRHPMSACSIDPQPPFPTQRRLSRQQVDSFYLAIVVSPGTYLSMAQERGEYSGAKTQLLYRY